MTSPEYHKAASAYLDCQAAAWLIFTDNALLHRANSIDDEVEGHGSSASFAYWDQHKDAMTDLIARVRKDASCDGQGIDGYAVHFIRTYIVQGGESCPVDVRSRILRHLAKRAQDQRGRLSDLRRSDRRKAMYGTQELKNELHLGTKPGSPQLYHLGKDQSGPPRSFLQRCAEHYMRHF
ncbi:hypothetical protein TI39_contig5854g00003 [Zymoseptoria brevis]|uniref:Uncharacterized protein n=1 Tax=Zymoseptoria brevis TaxID=1047168 RepID=A0A0F4G4Z6_9PEZI|nr:hypothetical protein TI39_contig5854g00003 [Zymoseptoria brevis]